MAEIRVSDLGEGGVDVDTNPTRTADNVASELQNATYDSTRKRLGGLTKRSGLARLNATSLTDVVLGGIEAPYTGVALATGTGGGTLGLGGMSERVGGLGGNFAAPGEYKSGGQTALQTSVITNGVGGSKIFNGRRLIIIGRDLRTGGVANDNGMGWYLTSEQFQDTAWLIGTNDPDAIAGPGPPGGCRESVPNDNHRASPAASAIVDGWVYYALHLVATSGTPATDTRGQIRRTNGYVDEIVTTIPANAWNTDARQANRVVSMLAADGVIYITVCDKGQTPGGESTSTNPDWGRVFQLNTTTRALVEMNLTSAVTPAGFARVPFSLASYAGRLFLGGFSTSASENVSTVEYPQPDLATVVDQQLTNPFFRASCMVVYSGQLYIGYHMRDTGVGVIDFAQVYTRVAAAATPGNSPFSSSLTATGGTAQADNRFVSMVVFGGNLYASYFNNTQTAKIYKFDGTTWTTVYTASTVSTRAPLYLFVDTNAAGTASVYAFGLSENNSMTWLYSTDGTTWTDQTANFASNPHGTTFSTSEALPIFFAFDQK